MELVRVTYKARERELLRRDQMVVRENTNVCSIFYQLSSLKFCFYHQLFPSQLTKEKQLSFVIIIIIMMALSLFLCFLLAGYVCSLWE